MIEWAILASGLVSAMTPYLVKGAEKMVEKAAEEGWVERGKIWETVKGLFIGDEKMLHIYEAYPDTEKIEQDFTKALEGKLKEAPADVVSELERLYKAVPQQVKSNVMNVTGNNNVAMQDISGSRISIGSSHSKPSDDEE